MGQNQAYPGRNAASSPIQVGSSGDWAILAKSAGHKTRNPIAIKTNGELWIWGENENGGLGQNNRTTYSSPVQVPGSAIWGDISATGIDYGASGIKVGLTPSQL